MPKISKGIFFQTFGQTVVGPHASPSNLFWRWHESILEFLHHDRAFDFAAMSEMVEPADPDWIKELSAVGRPKQVPCHLFGGGALRDRILYCHPDIKVPTPEHKTQSNTSRLWDGAYWPIGRTTVPFPPTIRAIMPHLAVKVLDGRAQPKEREQMCSLRVGHDDGSLKLPSPIHVAQWLGVPRHEAEPWLSATSNCQRVVDDIDGEDMDYWGTMPINQRPPADRVSQCRTKRWCKYCGNVISLLGNGWHVGATSAVLAEILRTAALAKLGLGPHYPHDFQKYPVHRCPATGKCPKATALEELRNKQKIARLPPPPPLIIV